MRVVLDTNVIVSAFLQPPGPSGRILGTFLDRGTFALVLSEAILLELGRALRYPRVRKRLKLSDDEIDLRVASLGVLSEIAPGKLNVRAVPDDPDDDKYVVTALEGRADFIVSGDSHLLSLKEFQGMRILRPRAFLDLLEVI